MKVIRKPIVFEWDTGNIDKNTKHEVNNREAEEVFFDKKKRTFRDHVHSQGEERFRVVGKTKTSRVLFVAFTIRKGCVRIISARSINRKEAFLYEEKISATKI